ncbi:MAG TPA: phosphocholine cytidylyltransferase family protein [Spirochaetota bacterium]|nr:phosphocholine cytidylyltransferase family protein [Spirochaetota bacterium]
MKAIILAAGRGKRMGSLTDDRPKCFVSLSKKPLIQWQLEALQGAGIEGIGLVRGYMGELFTDPSIHYFTNSRWSETNMVMSLVCAAEWLKKVTCIISYSDIVYSSDTVKRLMNSPGNIAITYDADWFSLWSKRFANPLDDAETFSINENNCLTEIGGKTKNVEQIKGQYMGLLKITPEGYKTIETYLDSCSAQQRNKHDMTSMLSALLKRGAVINTVKVNGQWFEVDNENDMNLYESLTKNTSGKLW